MTAAAMTAPVGPDRYPVNVTFDETQEVNRLWGIPILGYVLRWLALIPNFIVLWFASIALALSLLVSWALVLILGRQPFAGFYKWFLTYAAQVSGWAFFLAAPLPPFLGSDPNYPVKVTMPTEGPVFRLWGFPYLGLVLRAVVVLPHFLVALAFAIVAYLFAFLLWIPILINGRVPRAAYTVFGGLIRLQIRIYAWYLLCPVPYPPLTP